VSSRPEAPPYEAYAVIVGGFFAGLAFVATAARRSPPGTAIDLIALSAATFKASRTLSRERVGSFFRQPFVEGQAEFGEDEAPKGEGLQRAIGELVTCPRCLGTWSAAGLAATQMVTPRFGRLLVWSLGASAANDFLQAAFTALCEKANRLEEEAEQTL
jgi:hypothetical protein